MPAPSSFDYGIVRVVPRVERGEFVNVGVVLFSRTRRFLAARIELDVPRLLALAPEIDLAEVKRHLAVFPRVAAGAIGLAGVEERGQVVRGDGAVAVARSGGADLHPAIDLARVDADDLGVDERRQEERDLALPRGGGAQDDDALAGHEVHRELAREHPRRERARQGFELSGRDHHELRHRLEQGKLRPDDVANTVHRRERGLPRHALRRERREGARRWFIGP